MISFTVNRSSVCMGDDVESHAVGYTMSDEADLETLFEQLRRDGFFPCVHGNNVVWVLKSGGSRVFSYFTKTERAFPELTGWKIAEILPPDDRLYFAYYTSPANWKKHIETGEVEPHSGEIEHCDMLK